MMEKHKELNGPVGAASAAALHEETEARIRKKILKKIKKSKVPLYDGSFV